MRNSSHCRIKIARGRTLCPRNFLDHPPVVSIDKMIERCDLAVEAASQVTLQEFVPKALAAGPVLLAREHLPVRQVLRQKQILVIARFH